MGFQVSFRSRRQGQASKPLSLSLWPQLLHPLLLLLIPLQGGCGDALRDTSDAIGLTKPKVHKVSDKHPGQNGNHGGDPDGDGPPGASPEGPEGAEKPEGVSAGERLLSLLGSEVSKWGTLSVQQIERLVFDGTRDLRCGDSLANPAFRELSDRLGGFETDLENTQLYRDLELPVFGYSDFGERSHGAYATPAQAESALDSAATAGAVPEIARADKVGRVGNRVVYLSARYGLFFVDVSDAANPKVSCSALVPGRPRNFYLRNDRLILLTDSGWGSASRAALIAFDLQAEGLRYSFHRELEGQSIIDSRMFNDTLAVFTKSYPEADDTQVRASGVDSAASGLAVAVSDVAGFAAPGRWYGETADSRLSVFNIVASGFELSFEEVFAESEVFDLRHDQVAPDRVGSVYSRTVRPLSFLSASDRYLLVGRQINEQILVGTQRRTSSWSTCVDWNPRVHEVKQRYCAPQWSFEANPAHNPAFRCALGTGFEACVQENESKFSPGKWKSTGVSCQTWSYWQGACMKQQTVTNEWHQPILEQREKTELAVYAFDNGQFVRLDDPAAAAGTFSIPGRALEHKSFSFRNGYLYSVMSTPLNGSTSRATEVRAFRVTENALVAAGMLTGIAPGEALKAVLFDSDELYFVTFREVDPLFTVDLSVPAEPRLAGELKVPGYSGQLIASGDFLLGIGQEPAPSVPGFRSSWRPKISLYDVKDLASPSEIETHIFATDVSSAWTAAETDDQVYHFSQPTQTLYVPLSVYDWKPSERLCQSTNTQSGRIAIAELQAGRLKSDEVDLSGFVDRVIETGQGNALAFGSSLIGALSRGDTGGWKSEALHLSPRTVGIYRLPGTDRVVALQATEIAGKVSRLQLVLGTRDGLENGDSLAAVDLPVELVSCYGMPTVRFFGNKVLFLFRSTAWRGGEQFESRFEYAYGFSGDQIHVLDSSETQDLVGRRISWCQLPPSDAAGFEPDGLVRGYFDGLFPCELHEPENVWVWNSWECSTRGLCAAW